MSFISLEINTGTKTDPDWQYAVLKEDASISIEANSAIWDTDSGGGAFSYEFELPVEENLHILGTSCDMRGRSIYDQLYAKQFRLYCGGLCMFYGIVKLDEAVEIEEDDEGNHTVGISLNSDNYEWDDLLDGVNARDVTLATGYRDSNNINHLDADSCNELLQNKIQIGYCVPSYFPMNLTITGDCYDNAYDYKKDYIGKITEKITTNFYITKILLPKFNSTDFTNTQHAYNPDNPASHPYCNVRICYPHYVQEAEQKSWTQKRGFSIGEPDRVNSAPCFYVMYWMHILFMQLGINVKENIMNDYEDFKRLAFYHTNCGYEEIDDASCYNLYLEECPISDEDVSNLDNTKRSNGIVAKLTINEMSQEIKPLKEQQMMTIIGTDGKEIKTPVKRIDYNKVEDPTTTTGHTIKWEKSDEKWICTKLPLYKAYATSDNFPDTDAKEILEALQSAFGLRYLYDAHDGSLRIILIKDVLTQTDVTNIECDIHKITKSENHVTGFRLKYSATQDAATNAISLKEDLTGEKQGTEGGDTTFSYNNFTNVKMLDNVKTMTDTTNAKTYGWLLNHAPSAYYDKTCYLHPITGNPFRIKVNGDAQGSTDLYPSLFAVAQFNKAEWGNCSNSKDNKDFIEEVTIGFTPIVENDVNCVMELVKNPDTDSSATGQILAQLVDGEFRSYSFTGSINDNDSKDGKYSASSVEYKFPLKSYKCYTSRQDSDKEDEEDKILITPTLPTLLTIAGLVTWDPAGNEPTEDNDTGFMLGIMRGSGGDAHTELIDDNYDKIEGHSKYINIPGSLSAFSADSVDQYGNMYDYNGGGTKTITQMYNIISGVQGVVNDVKVTTGQTISKDDTIATLSSGEKITSPYNGTIISLNLHINQQITQSQRVAYISGVTTEEEYNGLGYELDENISLRLRVEHPNPGYDPDCKKAGYKYSSDGKKVTFTNGTTVPNTKYFPIDESCAKRGLADKFYNEYAHWVLNRRIANITCTMELADLIAIDMTKKYRIAGYEGFIKSLSYTIDNIEGLSTVDIEFYYL